MSRSVDERVVEMQFQNQQFESGIKTSISSLDKLKNSLKLEDTGKSLSNLSEAGKKFSLAGIAEGVDTISAKFSALGVVAITALQNITNKAVDAGLAMVKSLTLEPIMGGFREYETKMGAITTVMTNTASKGTKLEDVNRVLGELNTYADKTIYNFGEMTRNIGTFTAAGVDLDVAARSIQGIANLAAGSGSTSQQASTAMYQLSQAIAAGKVNLQDWNSVVNAGMGGELFQNALKATAKEMGVVVDESKPFRASLEKGWLTTEILTATLSKFASDKSLLKAATQVKTFTQLWDTMQESVQSGWAVSWEHIVGDQAEAAKLLTGISDAFNNLMEPIADARNEMLKFWADNGGREAIIQSFVNVFKALESVLKPIGQAFSNLFPPMTGERLVTISKAIQEFTSKLILSAETSEKVKQVFSGLFSVLSLGKQAVGFVLNVIGELFKLFAGPASSAILDVTSRIGQFLTGLDAAAKKGDIFNNAFSKVKEAFAFVGDTISSAFEKIKAAFAGFDLSALNPFNSLVEKTKEQSLSFAKLGDVVKDVFSRISSAFESISPIAKQVGATISKIFSGIGDVLKNTFKNITFDDVVDLINSGLFAALLLGFKKFTKSLTGLVDEAGGFLGKITGVLDGVRDSLKAYQTSIQAKTLVTIAIAVGILAAALLVLSTIDGKKLTTALASMTTLFIELAGTMIGLNKALGSAPLAKVSVQLIAMSAALLVLTFAMKNLASLDAGQIMQGILGIGALSAVLVASAKMLSSSTGSLIKGGAGLVVFAASLLVLSQVVKQIAELPIEQMQSGLVGLGVMIAELAVFMKVTESIKGGVGQGLGLIAMAAAIKILVGVVSDFGAIDPSVLKQGLITIGVVLTELALFLKLTGNAKNVIQLSISMGILGASLLLFVEVLKSLSTLSWSELAVGLTALGGSLAIVTAAMRLLPGDLLIKSAGMVVLAAALLLMVEPLKALGQMTWEEIAKGLVALAGSMLILAVSLNVMQTALPGAAAMLVVSAALRIFVPVLQALGAMPLAAIGVALLALAGTFTVLGLAGLLLGPMVPVLQGLAIAVALLGVGLAAAGYGVTLFAAGLAALAAGSVASAAAIALLGAAVLDLIPKFFKKVGEGLTELSKVIIENAPTMGKAFTVFIEEGVKAIVAAIPEITDGIMILVVGILDSLDTYLPDVVDKLFSIVTTFLDMVADRMPELIAAGSKLIGNLIKGIFEAVGEFHPEQLGELLECFTMLLAAFAALALAKHLAKDAIIAAGAMVLVMGMIALLFIMLSALDMESTLEIAVSLSVVLVAMSAAMAILSLIPVAGAVKAVAGLAIFVTGLGLLLAALGGLKQIPGVDWLLSEGTDMLLKIGDAIGGFVGHIASGFMTGLTSGFPQIGQDLSDFMRNVTPFIEGAKQIDAQAMAGVQALAGTVLALTASSVMEGLTSWLTGGSSMLQFGQQIAEFAPYFTQYYEQIKGVDGSVVEASANAAMALAKFADNLPEQGGVAGWFMGENSLTAFAQELTTFGPALAAYAQSVAGLDANVVVNSTLAAQSLAEMATNLPNQGGVAGWFMGENSLSVFAQELAKFGPVLMSYAQSVTGLDANVVVNSTYAAQAIAEMATNLPNQGGVVGWFMGENSLSVFGAELAKFGPYLAAYAASVSGIDGNVVTNSANAAKALSELANNLPNQGGLVSWFTGDNSIGAFGDQLVKFGQKFKEYGDAVGTIDTTRLAGVITQVRALMDLATGMSSMNSEGMSAFVENLIKLADDGIKGFIEAFDNSHPQVLAAIEEMLTAMNTSVTTKTPELATSMTALMTAIITAVTTKTPELATAATNMMTEVEKAITAKSPAVSTAGVNVITALITAVRAKVPQFRSIGEEICNGLAQGIQAGQSQVIKAAVDVASNAYQAACDTLGIKSPSKMTMLMGKYFDQGFANGITDYSHVAKDAAVKTAEGTLSVMSNLMENIDDNINTEPIITPVLDLSDITDGEKKIGKILTRAPSINVAGIRANAEAANIAKPVSDEDTDKSKKTTIEFTQNNYSPKALSRTDIYRQTKNQFAAMKGLVTA